METITKLKELVLRKQQAQYYCNQNTQLNMSFEDYIKNSNTIKDCQEQIDKIILEA